MRALIKSIDFNNLNKIDSIETVKKTTINIGKKPERDIFKNINFLIDNKKSKMKIHDIKRNINYINNNDDFEKYIFNKRKSSLVNYKTTINEVDNEKNNNEDINNKEISKINDPERYIIYENSKKYIKADKIYYHRNHGFPNLPNVNLIPLSYSLICLIDTNIIIATNIIIPYNKSIITLLLFNYIIILLFLFLFLVMLLYEINLIYHDYHILKT